MFDSGEIKFIDLIFKEDIGAAKESLIKALKTDKSYKREFRIRNKTGKVMWIEDRGQIKCDPKGEIEYLTGIFYDITERKQTQDALMASKAYSESIIKNFLDTLIVVDTDFKIKTVNPATLDLLGYEKEEIIGQSIYTIFVEEHVFFPVF